MLRYLLDVCFVGGAEFEIMGFGPDLRPISLVLDLAAQEVPEQVAEYLIHEFGSYQRFHRDPDQFVPVTEGERAILNLGVSTFVDLAAKYGSLLTQPVPPRYRADGQMAPTSSH